MKKTAFDRWQDAARKTYLDKNVDDEDTWSEGLDYWTSEDEEE